VFFTQDKRNQIQIKSKLKGRKGSIFIIVSIGIALMLSYVNFSLFSSDYNPPPNRLVSPLSTLALQGKEDQGQRESFQYFTFAMGTRFNLTLVGYDQQAGAHAAQIAFKELKRIENKVSSWIPHSEIGILNQQAGQLNPVVISQETHWLLSKAQSITQKTRGSFDLTWATLKGLWDFKKKKIPLHSLIRERLSWVGSHFLTLTPLISNPSVSSPQEPLYTSPSSTSSPLIQSKPNVHKQIQPVYTASLSHPQTQVDLGGIAKGYAVDQMAWVLKKVGYTDFIVDGGGDVYMYGRQVNGEAWSVGVQHPRSQDLFTRLTIPSGWSVVSSGDYERFFVAEGQRWHHIIDLRTGYPAQGSVATTVLAKNTLEADAYATALFVLGPHEGLELAESLPGIEALFFGPTGEIIVTSGINNFTTNIPKYWKNKELNTRESPK
jgi:thiamine biosynthesis lipoprotein